MTEAVATPAQDTNIHFNEAQWLQALFLLADTVIVAGRKMQVIPSKGSEPLLSG